MSTFIAKQMSLKGNGTLSMPQAVWTGLHLLPLDSSW